MIKPEVLKKVSSVLCAILPLSCLFCGSDIKNLKSVDCDQNCTLILGVHKELKELSYVNIYNLYFQKDSGSEKKLVTGENAVLPRVKRYRDMITVRDFKPQKNKSIFDYHYVDPVKFSKDEFIAICNCYEKNYNQFPVINNCIGALVYGSHRLFREVFSLPGGLYLTTEIDGGISIVTDPSSENMTEIPEKRHFNIVGYFDDNNMLHIRKGKIISDTMNGFYGKPVKQVLFVTEDGSVDYTGEIEVIWADILYCKEKPGVNIEYVLSAKNSNGEKLGDVFKYKDFYLR